MNKAVFFILVLSLFFHKNRLFAQEKFEKESRLKEKQVPAKALNFLDFLIYLPNVLCYMITLLSVV